MDNSEIFTFIEGKTVDLAPINSEHVKLYVKWINDPKVREYALGSLPTTLEEVKNWFKLPKEGLKNFIFFEIWHKKDGKPIGIIQLNNIMWFDRTADFFIFIGDTDYWGHNIAKESAKLLFKYAFNEINLNRLNAWVAIENIRSLTFAEKIGFISETILKQQWYYDGKYVDVNIFRLLKEEWIKKKE